MKVVTRCQRLRLSAVAAMLAGSTFILGAPAQGVGINSSECPLGYQSRAPITIRTEQDWTPAYGVRSGTGTIEDPYVISCWTIAITSQDAISILPSATLRTNEEGDDLVPIAFEINNVNVIGSGLSPGRGIVLFSSIKARVRNNSVRGTYIGIDSTGVDVEIVDNYLDENDTGISFGQRATISSISRSHPYSSLGAMISYNDVTALNCISVADGATAIVTSNTCYGSRFRQGTGISLGVGSGGERNSVTGFGTGVFLNTASFKWNTVTNNRWGIMSRGDLNLVDGNIILDNSGGMFLDSSGDVITNNVIRSSGGNGIETSGETTSKSMHGNIIDNNFIESNNGNGISIGSKASLNMIRGNSIKYNQGIGLRISGEATANSVIANLITSNSGGGIDLGDDAYGNTISGNTIWSNYGAAINILGDATYNTIGANSLQWNAGAGIGLAASHNTITGNTIERNTGKGIEIVGRFNTVQSNRIGWNSAAGIFLGPDALGNLVEKTVWSDGYQSIGVSQDVSVGCHPNYSRTLLPNSVVDAGSNKTRLGTGSVTFSDYYPDVILVPEFLSLVPESRNQMTVTWSYGDGTSAETKTYTMAISQATCPPAFTHVYQATGTYTALLAVNTTSPDGEPHTYTDEVLVTIR